MMMRSTTTLACCGPAASMARHTANATKGCLAASATPCRVMGVPRRKIMTTSSSTMSATHLPQRSAPSAFLRFGRGLPLRGEGSPSSGGRGATAAAAVDDATNTEPTAAPPLDLTHTSPVIFARRTPEERRRDKLGVQKILAVAKERATKGENEDGLLRFFGYYGKKNQSLRSGSALYANVFYRSLDEEFYDLLGYEEKGLLPWFLISTLHMWMTSVRLRKDESSRALDTRAYFADSFWMDVEEKLNNVGVNYVGMGKAMKVMPSLYANATLTLDKALKSNSDDQLGDALFRHIFFNRLPHQAHMTALITYVRQELAQLDAIPNNLLLHGYLPWGSLPRVSIEEAVPQHPASPDGADHAQQQRQ